MKTNSTIFITMGEPLVVRNIFGTTFWPEFLKEFGGVVQVVILALPDIVDRYRKVIEAPGVIFEAVNPSFTSRYASMVTSFARSAVNNHTNLWSKMRSYERGDSSFIATVFKRIHTVLLGDANWYKQLLRRMILAIKPVPALADLFDRYQPQLLIETSITNFDFDVPVATETRRRGIKILGITRGWDNFTSHGLMRVVPDKILIQNAFLREMAVRYQAVDPVKTELEVIGIPHYDWYKQLNQYVEPREQFFTRMGLAANKKFILYGAMGDFLFPREGEIADILEELIASGKIKEPARVIFRTHPKFKSSLERMKGMLHVIPDRAVASESGGIALTREDNDRMINSLFHCDVLVTGASTMAIDGAALDKPIVCVAFDGVAKVDEVSYWHSVKRFYDSYTHFEDLVETGGVRIAYTPDELAAHINSYLSDPSQDRGGRKKILERFVEPFDGKATERFGRAIAAEVRKIVTHQ